jgi:sortase A
MKGLALGGHARGRVRSLEGGWPSVDRALRLVALLCLFAGVALLASFAYGTLAGIREQQRLTDGWRAELTRQPPPPAHLAQPVPDLMKPVNGVDFAIRVPKLGYYSAVKEGTDLSVLYDSPGHYSDTRWPGQTGMVGVAAHNVYWVDFPQLGKGDEVDLETRYGTFKYRVTGSRIVEPDDRTILVQGPGRHLTLTTCWPTWAGAWATRRFIVFTDQTWPVPPSNEHPGS